MEHNKHTGPNPGDLRSTYYLTEQRIVQAMGAEAQARVVRDKIAAAACGKTAVHQGISVRWSYNREGNDTAANRTRDYFREKFGQLPEHTILDVYTSTAPEVPAQEFHSVLRDDPRALAKMLARGIFKVTGHELEIRRGVASGFDGYVQEWQALTDQDGPLPVFSRLIVPEHIGPRSQPKLLEHDYLIVPYLEIPDSVQS
jgi:hypothetical protein